MGAGPQGGGRAQAMVGPRDPWRTLKRARSRGWDPAGQARSFQRSGSGQSSKHRVRGEAEDRVEAEAGDRGGGGRSGEAEAGDRAEGAER